MTSSSDFCIRVIDRGRATRRLWRSRSNIPDSLASVENGLFIKAACYTAPPAQSAVRAKTFMSVAESSVDDRRRTSIWLLLIGVAFRGGAGATYSVLRAAFGDRPAHINVRWS